MDDLPPSFNGATFLTKPAPMTELLAAVRGCILPYISKPVNTDEMLSLMRVLLFR
jgi:DNA-binding response OmpR family regulator